VTGAAPGAGGEAALLAQISAEHRYQRLAELVEELERLPQVSDCTVVLPLVSHPRWQVRQAAIGALGKARGDSRAETALLGVLAGPVDEHDRIIASAALGEAGTRAAIPALAAHIHHPQDDVKCAATYALARIGGAPELAIFLDALTDRSPAAKWYAIAAIARHGTQQAIGPVCDRVRVILRRQRHQGQLPESELLLALQFLARHPGDERASATLTWVAERKLSYLTPHEARWAHRHLTMSSGSGTDLAAPGGHEQARPYPAPRPGHDGRHR
jgi:hypothetical protein